MAEIKRIALVGDYNPDVLAHIAIPKAIDIASKTSDQPIECDWIETIDFRNPVEALREFDAVWCVPASPYNNMDGALGAIRLARETGLPFLGTCGGYQHAALEFARNVLGLAKADNGEVNADAEMPLIAPLACTLVEQSGEIVFVPDSRIAKIHGATRVTETYHCSYGLAPRYLNLFDDSELDIAGFDNQGDPRTIEIKSHPFFIGTAYQPERSALSNQSHPLIEAFIAAAAGKLSMAV